MIDNHDKKISVFDNQNVTNKSGSIYEPLLLSTNEMLQINYIETNQLVLYFPAGSGYFISALEGKNLFFMQV